MTDVSTSTPSSRADVSAEPRETSGATTALIVRYVRERGGEPAVAAMLRRAGVPHTAAELAEESRWTSYDTRIRLFAAATEVLGDPGTPFEIGRTALTHGLNHSLVLLIRAMGSPRQVFRQLPRAVPKFSTTSTMHVVESGATHATIRYRLHEGYVHSRLDCAYAQGLFAMVPTIFGLPPTRIVHEECESDGHPECIYHLTWNRRRRFSLRGRDSADAELVALRGQLQALQSAASDLVSSDHLDTVLARITDRAAAAVLAPAYLLAVHPPTGGPALVHSAGVEAAATRRLADALLAGADLGPTAVVVDVASTRRMHGRLAALYTEGHRGMVDERSLLAAYAGHAAAALDLLVALEDSRSEARRATALLDLARELARAGDATAVAATVACALPRIVECAQATVLLWNSGRGELRALACAGLSDGLRDVLLSTPMRGEDYPELLELLTSRTPALLRAPAASPRLRQLFDTFGVSDAVAVPILAGETFLGVAAAGWETGGAPRQPAGEELARLRGVADQAATALENARLLDTIRHQASHDALTGLPNRQLFTDRLERELAAAGPQDGAAVLFCDLDRFKEVNDVLGHAAGDELLRQVAARLRGAVRPGDTVGRLSGDEFALLLPGLGEEDLAETLAARVVGCFQRPFRLDGSEVEVTTSVGLALHAGAGGDAEALLREADRAMYAAKKHGRNRVASARRS